MQLESLIIANDNNEILFACHCLPKGKTWNDYVDRLVKLIPAGGSPNFLLYDDLVIGLGTVKDLRIIITAPLTSNFVVEPIMDLAIAHITKMLLFISKEDQIQPALLKRDNYISLQILIQSEISASGHMRFGNPSEFEAIADF
jgi:hypothetical protein